MVLAVKFNVEPSQIGPLLTAVGADGTGFTLTVVDAGDDEPLQPLAVTLTVEVPENPAAQLTVPVAPVPEIVLPVPVTVQL